ncbi:MAG: hypothetical protein EOO20_11480 [Chryseobacterium sp.]|nr:MAG: hypothetical protein EOO20_11480 [Chryseobacterium sp.]
MNICETFRLLAAKTWRNIAIGRSVGHQLLEETLTDINLLHLKFHHPEILTVNFNKIVEGSNGADWEWWFYDVSGNWIGLRVQAKILDFKKEQFNQLYYKKDRSTPAQCDLLIVNAMADPVNPCIPLYVLYLQSDHYPDPADHLGVKDMFSFGCSVVSAYAIRDLKSTKNKSLKDWQAELKPWETLVCEKESRPFMNVEDMLEAIKERFGVEETVKRPGFLQQRPPRYISQILNSEGNLSNLETTPPDLAGVVIVKIDQDAQ